MRVKPELPSLNCSNCLVNSFRFGVFIAHFVAVVKTRISRFWCGSGLPLEFLDISKIAIRTTQLELQTAQHHFRTHYPEHRVRVRFGRAPGMRSLLLIQTQRRADLRGSSNIGDLVKLEVPDQRFERPFVLLEDRIRFYLAHHMV